MQQPTACWQWLRSVAIVTAMLGAGIAHADPLSGAALVSALQQGGYVLLMRHASSPATPPASDSAERDNTRLERQLDPAGRNSALAMGAALRTLAIPLGGVWSSPTYRARQTVHLANFPNAMTASELSDGGQSMQPVSKGQTAWLQEKLAERPRAGSNTVIVTQYPNILDAVGQKASGLTDGEALVLRPDGTGAEEIVGRIKIDDWAALASHAKLRKE